MTEREMNLMKLHTSYHDEENGLYYIRVPRGWIYRFRDHRYSIAEMEGESPEEWVHTYVFVHE